MHIPRWPARPLALLACIALPACTVGPDYVRPAVDTPAAWRVDYPKAAEVANTPWWKQFGDPVLDDLIDATLRDNRDIRISAAPVDQFMGALTSTRSQLYPQLGYGADTTRTRQSRVGTPPIPEPASPYFTIYQASLARRLARADSLCRRMRPQRSISQLTDSSASYEDCGFGMRRESSGVALASVVCARAPVAP
jgi:hypothetical protein